MSLFKDQKEMQESKKKNSSINCSNCGYEQKDSDLNGFNAHNCEHELKRRLKISQEELHQIYGNFQILDAKSKMLSMYLVEISSMITEALIKFNK